MKACLSILGIMICVHRSVALQSPVLEIDAVLDSLGIQVNLSWSPSFAADYYNVYLKSAESEPDSFLVSTTDLSYSMFVPISIEMQSRIFMFYVLAVDECQFEASDLTFVPSGTFSMGQIGVPGATPVQTVTLTNSFLLGTYEVTNQQYAAGLQWAYDNDRIIVSGNSVEAHGQVLMVMDGAFSEIDFADGVFSVQSRTTSNGYEGPGYAYPDGYNPALHPVHMLSWFGAACYCDWLSEIEGLEPYYLGNWTQTSEHYPYTAEGYRLPTEAEWEYAARFSGSRVYPWGDITPDCDFANHEHVDEDNEIERCVGWTSPVGSYPSGVNALGIYDLAGNVFEFCGDRYWLYSSGSSIDPIGSADENYRAFRGGSFYNQASSLRASGRPIAPSTYIDIAFGFRICRTCN